MIDRCIETPLDHRDGKKSGMLIVRGDETATVLGDDVGSRSVDGVATSKNLSVGVLFGRRLDRSRYGWTALSVVGDWIEALLASGSGIPEEQVPAC